MNDIMQRFRPRARKALNLCLKEAEQLDDAMIHSGHLLLALRQVEGSVSQRVLETMLPSVDALRSEMEAFITFKSWRVEKKAIQIISLAPDIRQSLVFCLDEARQRKDETIGTEHLLLGLCRLDEGLLVIELLKQLKLRPEAIRAKTLEVLGER